ncbi:Acyltransferase 3 domain-containing protein [Aphelenchoides besseyi]|nr:Acyltransferase 3 domain-containing protein [Aphelenchoides besseyi]
MILRTSFLVLFTWLLTCSTTQSEDIRSYSEAQVWSFIQSLSAANVSSNCARSLSHVIPYLTANSTLNLQRTLFYESYAVGEAKQFISRDMGRWFHRSLECLKVSGETSYSASGYPSSYCYAMDENKVELAYGICIPTPCENDRQILLNSWQSAISHDQNQSTLDFNDSDCARSRHQVQWYERLQPMFHFSVDFVLSFLVCLGTIYDIKKGGKSSSTAGRLLMAFSYTGNCKKLIQMPKDVNSTITCMFGLRFLCVAWTLIGHSFHIFQSFVSNIDEYRDEITNNFWNQWISNFTLSVDVFLVLSGTLTAYSWFKKWYGTDTAPGFTSFGYWLRFYRHRLVRLWPALAYTLFTLIARLSWTHFHPIFPPTDPAKECLKNGNWMKNLFMLNSLSGNLCVGWTWYISTEFIFYLLAPIFLVTLHRSPIWGFNLSILVILFSAALNVATMYNYNFPPIPLSYHVPSIFNQDFLLHHYVLYIKPYCRIAPYIIGLLLGYFLAQLGKMPEKSVGERKSTFIFWFIATIAGFWSLFGAYPALQGWNWPFYHLFYGTTFRVVFSIAISWLIYACHTGRAGLINRVLSAWILLPLSSLSYSVYLIHMVPITFTFLLEDFPIVYTSKWPILLHCLVQLIISYVMGARTALVAELPAMNIERVLLSNDPPPKFKPVPT